MKRFDDAPTVDHDAKRELAWRQNGRDHTGAEVEQMLRRRGSEGLPQAMPTTIQAATAWILDYLIDPPADDETIRLVPTLLGVTWLTPYRDRAVHLARKFLHLPQGEQQGIIAYRKDGIIWRGDDVEFLALLAAERLRRA